MEERIIAVIDTSVWIAMFKSKSLNSNTQKLKKAFTNGEFTNAATRQTLEELALILKRLNFTKDFIKRTIQDIQKKSIYYPGAYQTNRLDNVDPKDNILLAACLESNAKYLITEDTALLNLKHIDAIQIVYPDSFLKSIKKNIKCKDIKDIKKTIKESLSFIKG